MSPDEHIAIGDAASCSLWRKTGAIGHFRAHDVASGAEHGCKRAVGPMDGSTWSSYRLATQRGEEPPFFLEPYTPAHWQACFTRAGFGILARYCSSVQQDLAVDDARLAGVERRAAAAGIRLRSFDPDCAERELLAMHALAEEAFRDAFLFSRSRARHSSRSTRGCCRSRAPSWCNLPSKTASWSRSYSRAQSTRSCTRTASR